MIPMPGDMQSIEDLYKKPAQKGPSDGSGTNAPSTEEKFEEKMHEVRLKEKEKEAERQAASIGTQYVNLKGFPISPEALMQVPEADAKRLKAVCFLYTGPQIRLGATDPTNPDLIDFLHQQEERLQSEGAIYKISEESLRIGLEAYSKLPKIKKIVKGVKVTDDDLQRFQSQMHSFADIQGILDGASITDVVTIVMAASLQFGTSDVHIEAEEEKVVIRYRIDGVLQEIAALPHEDWKKIIARIKLISGLKINVVERPQDGRFTIFLKEGDTDVRVSTIPTTWGESVVMRLLKPSAINVEFEQLGWRPLVQKKLEHEIGKPHGMIITTGPTGSGKTTTLYAILRKLNSSDVKIITLEDPIEYKLEGINQSQIDHSKDYTFAGGLRSILRQDPDIVMVGEIRDLETAETAINAALTGHLLLSTLHTNDAAGAIPRYIAMGVKPFLLSPALNAIIGQRLARRVHKDCAEPYTPTPEELETFKKIISDIPEASGEVVPPEAEWKFVKGKGCEVCNNSGYKGRVGVYELLLMSEEIKGSMSETISEFEVRQLAKKQGMTTMQQDGMLKVLDGFTTIEEVVRVAGSGE